MLTLLQSLSGAGTSGYINNEKYMGPDSPAAFIKGAAITVMHYFRLMKSLGRELDSKAENVTNSEKNIQALNLLVHTTKQIDH